jgi:hypothetical protein
VEVSSVLVMEEGAFRTESTLTFYVNGKKVCIYFTLSSLALYMAFAFIASCSFPVALVM